MCEEEVLENPTLEELEKENGELRGKNTRLSEENTKLVQAVQQLQGAMEKAKNMSFFMQEQFYDRMTRGAGQ